MKREHLTVLLRTLLWFSNSKDKEVDGGEAVRQRDVIDERALVEWMEINGPPPAVESHGAFTPLLQSSSAVV